MSTLTADPPMTSHAAAQVHPTFAGIMRGVSTWWALASTTAVITLVALAAAMSLNAMTDDPTPARSAPPARPPRPGPGPPNASPP